MKNSELNIIAEDPDQDNVLLVNNFKELPSIMWKLIGRVCHFGKGEIYEQVGTKMIPPKFSVIYL